MACVKVVVTHPDRLSAALVVYHRGTRSQIICWVVRAAGGNVCARKVLLCCCFAALSVDLSIAARPACVACLACRFILCSCLAQLLLACNMHSVAIGRPALRRRGYDAPLHSDLTRVGPHPPRQSRHGARPRRSPACGHRSHQGAAGFVQLPSISCRFQRCHAVCMARVVRGDSRGFGLGGLLLGRLPPRRALLGSSRARRRAAAPAAAAPLPAA